LGLRVRECSVHYGMVFVWCLIGVVCVLPITSLPLSLPG
jgi:hypothetical protein